MKLSVLICTYNRHEMLNMVLDSLMTNTHEKPEQIVVVNGGDKRANDVVESFISAPTLEIKLIETVNRNLATSRNIGLRHCSGDIIAMTDDDAKVFPDWILLMKGVHQEHPEAGAVGGVVLGTNIDSIVGKVADLITFPSWPTCRYVTTLPGVNISYKRQVLEKIGFQDETLFRGEDVDYNWRVLKAGYKIYFDPAIKVYHHHRPNFGSLLHQHYMYGRAYYLVRKKWPDIYCIYPRTFKKLNDVLKTVNFFASLFYLPLIYALRLKTWGDRLLSVPILFSAGFGWRSGMIIQRFRKS